MTDPTNRPKQIKAVARAMAASGYRGADEPAQAFYRRLARAAIAALPLQTLDTQGEVSQGDREAAADLMERWECEDRAPYVSGEFDEGEIVQAFAHYRRRLALSPTDQRAEERWYPVGHPDTPRACHVLAARFDIDCGEWVYGFVASPPIKPFTHWRMPPSPPVGDT